jgi:hypothetical protein
MTASRRTGHRFEHERLQAWLAQRAVVDPLARVAVRPLTHKTISLSHYALLLSMSTELIDLHRARSQKRKGIPAPTTTPIINDVTTINGSMSFPFSWPGLHTICDL